jgi:hypothetical protein
MELLSVVKARYCETIRQTTQKTMPLRRFRLAPADKRQAEQVTCPTAYGMIPADNLF